MKVFVVAAMVIGMAFGVLAQDANLLNDKWRIYGNKENTTIDAKTKEVTCVLKDTKAYSGVFQTVTLNQTAPKAITFSAESKAADVKGANLSANYALYLDITLMDGSKVYGKVAAFKGGTHDWEKAQTVYLPPKAIKSINFYALFRLGTGTVSFRNIVLTQAK